MAAKEYLSQAFVIKKIVNAKRSRVEDLRGLLCCLDEMHASGDSRHDWPNAGLGCLKRAINGTIGELVTELGRLHDVQNEIAMVVGKVGNPDCRALLYERYVNLKRWEDIARESSYSLRHVYKLRRQGLSEVGKILDMEAKKFDRPAHNG